MRDGSSAIRFLFLKEDPERTEEVAKIEEMAWEQKEKVKKRGGGSSNQAFNNEVILEHIYPKNIDNYPH